MSNMAESIDGIAIVGMSCRLPGAKTINYFWQNLRNGVGSVTFFSDRELLEAGVDESFIKDPRYVKAGCVVEDIDLFDHRFFGYSPKEAETIDPQQRLFMECAWESFEDAGYVPYTYEGRIGVFGGMRMSTYVQNMLFAYNRIGTAASFQALIGTDKDYLTNRVSYKFNLKGPSITVQTACSTSLVAVHMACESLRNGECDMALAGGVALSVPQKQGYFYQEDMIFSPDGHCRAFDAGAQGIIGGNGVGAVLLKPLSNALEDGDHIYAVIKGSSVNNDGLAKAGYTAPSIEGQTVVISEAIAMADVSAEDITYVETHGTGTPLGDPMEIEALTRVFRSDTDKNKYCAIGSVKTNIGHLDTAAGVASLIKTVLALKNCEIPPSLHFERPNPKIDFDKSPFFVNTSLTKCQRNGAPLTAGVSSFGIGGTNAHVIVQEKPSLSSPEERVAPLCSLLVISALSENVLHNLADNYKKFFENNPEASLLDIGFTMSVGRSHLPCRLAVRAASLEEALSRIDTFLAGNCAPGVKAGHVQSETALPLAFLFTGQGSQYQGMGRALYDIQPMFREALDRCAEVLEKYIDRPLLSVIFDDDTLINETCYTQPALFAIEYALARMWQSWGVAPSAVIGHSVGEYVAACIAGVFSLEDGLMLIAARARLMQGLPQNGTMLAVFAGEETVLSELTTYEKEVSIAALNGADLVVISGVTEAVENIAAALSRKGIESQKLTVSHAFHSPLMEPILPEFMEAARRVTYHSPKITLISNLTGARAGSEICSPEYWRDHILRPVRFASGMKALEEEGYKLFLEVGPRPVLSGMGKRCVSPGSCEFLPTMRKEADPWTSVLNALGGLYVSGVSINWTDFYREYECRRVSLPTYPFDRKRHWIDKPAAEKAVQNDAVFDANRLWEELAGAAGSQAQNGLEEAAIDRCREESDLIGRLCGYYVGQAFKSLGAFEDPDEKFSVETFLFQTPVMPRYGQLLAWLLEGMAREGLLEGSEEGYGNLVTMGEDEAEELYEKLREGYIFSKNPDLIRDIKGYCQKLGDILAGYEETECAFIHNNSFSVTEGLYRDLPQSLYYNGIVKALVECIAGTVPGQYQLRILEIGGGTGELAGSLLPALPAERTEYSFTDLSDFIIDYTKEKLGDIPFIKYDTLDIQENPGEQGFDKNRYDLVIAGNVLHAARDIGEAAGHILSLLASRGVLIVRELASHRLLNDVLFGPFIGEIEDDEYRGKSAFPTAERWQEILEASGFSDVVLVPEAHSLGECVIIARAPEEQSLSCIPAFLSPVKAEKSMPADFYRPEEHSLLGIRYNTALPVFEKRVSCKDADFIEHYKVLDTIVAPVSFYYVSACAAGTELLGSRELQLEDLSMFDPLIFLNSGEARTTQLIFTDKSSDSLSFKFFSKQGENDDGAAVWSLNFSGGIKVKSPGDKPAEEGGSGFNDLPGGSPGEILNGEFYEGFDNSGIKYGYSLQGVQRFVKKGTEALASVRLTERENGDPGIWHYNPGIIESCVQVALALARDDAPGKENAGKYHYFPTHIKTMFFEPSFPMEFRIHASIKNNDGDGSSFIVDLRLYDTDNNPVGEVAGMALNRFSSSEVRRFIERKELSPLPGGDKTAAEMLPGEKTRLLEDLRKASDEERRVLLEDYLLTVFAQILRMAGDEISPDDDFIQLGLDSLLFLELNQTLARDLKVRITAQEAFETPYIRALVDRLTNEIGSRGDSGGGPDGDMAIILDPVEAIGGPITEDVENRYQPFNLTNVQYAYWIGRSGILDLGNVSCHFYFEVERDELDVKSFSRAWNKVVERHDMLRSVILPEGKQQILKWVPPYEVTENDFTNLTVEDAESRLMEIRHNMSHQVISSDEWPLFEIRVSFLPGGRVRMHFSIELLNADVMSIQIIFSEVDRFLKDPGYSPKPLEISFRDYVMAENALRKTEFYNRSRDYWIKQIADMPPAPDLPLANSLSGVQNQRFSSIVFELDCDTWGSLKKMAAQKGLTPSGVLLAAYSDILSAWSNNSKFIVSLAQFNRIPFHPDVYNITGDFTSILIMAMDATKGDTFLERAKAVQSDLWNHLEHRYFDGVEVIREMARGRRMGNEALIPVVFTSILGVGEQSEELYPWAVLGEVGYFVSQTPQVWLDNQVSERSGCLIVSWDVIEEIFPAGMLNDMLKAYENQLRRLACEEEAWLETGQVFVRESHIEMYKRVNATDGPVSPEMLHTLFTARVPRQEDRPAVIAPGRTLSYEDLYRRSNQVAHLLRDQGVRPNTLVAVIMEKGWEQVVAALGILLSGAAYLPINADMPVDRINHLLADGEVSIVLTQSFLVDSIPWPDFTRAFAVDTINITERGAAPPALINTPEDIAYVIYTSGSTGSPKGVVIDHRGAVNTILDINSRFDVGSGDRVLALSALNFDLSVYDIFGVLAAGGAIVMPEAQRAKDPAHWWELVEKEGITIWNSVPVLMQMLVDYNSGIPENLPQSLRLVLMSGDWIPVDLPGQVRSLFNNARVISLGGATEASIWSIIYPVEKVLPEWKSIPYGKPMVNQRFYVLDERLNFCPPLVTGHLYIGGIGVARRYWQDEEKTARSFITHPVTGERIYFTGDLGRYLPDGNIEFIGREDFQVKIRGYRVELGEIESVLRDHPGVQEAVVNVAGETSGEKKLYAYVVPGKNTDALFEMETVDAQEAARLWEGINKAGKGHAQIVPPSLSPCTFPEFCEYLERLSINIMRQVLRDMGAFVNRWERYSLDDLVERYSIQPRFKNLVGQWIKHLEKEKALQKDEGDVYTNPDPFPENALTGSLLDEIIAYPAWKDQAAELLDYFRETRLVYGSLLRGEVDPLELFLSEESMFTAKTMERFNPVKPFGANIVFSITGCLEQFFRGGKTLRILELGTRADNITEGILPLLPSENSSYTYSDASAFFLDKAREELRDYPFVEYKLFDFNKDPLNQNIDPHSYDVIIAPNTLHRASNIGISLGYVRSLMAAGGLLIVYEGTRNSSMQLVTVGLFEDGFSHFQDGRRESCLPLLSVEEWIWALNASGFEEVCSFPEAGDDTEVFGQSVIVARAPGSVARFNAGALYGYLLKKLHDYMVPAGFIQIDALPLMPNGKIDRKALPKPGDLSVNNQGRDYQEPGTETEKTIAGIWKKVLKVDLPGIHDDFIIMGGDSLQATQLVNLLREAFKVDIPLRILFEEATIHKLAQYIDTLLRTSEEEFEEGVL